MKLIALKNFSPDGIRELKAGEAFTISDSAGRFLVAIKHAKPVGEGADAQEEKRGRYKRRDIRAEK